MKNQQEDIMDDILRLLSEKSSNSEEEKNYGEDHVDRLKEAYDSFLRKEKFELGQIVKWKKNLKNRKIPHKNQPAIVVKILDEPIISTEDDSGSPYFLEKLDIVLGVMPNNGDFLTFHYDSRRFEPY